MIITATIALIAIAASPIYEYGRTHRTLTNLRANCFIPDERGVKVRYYQASDARRAKAERIDQ